MEMQTEILNNVIVYDRKNPFPSKLIKNFTLNHKGSNKDTRHFVFDLTGSNITYEPGDSLYVCPKNDPETVEELLGMLELIKSKEDELLRFTEEVNLTRPSNKLFSLLIEKLTEHEAEDIQVVEDFHEKFSGYSVLNLLKEFSNFKFTTDEIANNSSKLLPRAYSIASSQKNHPKRVALCVARVDEEVNGQKVLGVCSNYLSEGAPLNEVGVMIYVHENDKFRLPDDSAKDIIMIGPGTGIAPFRAFLEERIHLKENNKEIEHGRNWLFFGDQHKEFDYIYGDELDKFAADGHMTLTTAFSRDQEEKIYVQHKMQEHAAEIFDWIDSGAYFYVCGDARRMAKDVDATLHQIVAEGLAKKSNLDEAQAAEQAKDYIKKLKDDKRYCRDVY